MSASSFPNFPNFLDKHSHEAVISPADVVAPFLGNPELVVPDAVILTYQRLVIRRLEERGARKVDNYPGPWRSLWFPAAGPGAQVAVAGGFGIGAPAAAMVLEELVALGVRRFLNIGAAGCLQPDVRFGDVIICTGAVRDEGVSHHYVAAEKFSYPSPELTGQLEAALDEMGVPHLSGVTRTIDAPYRETIAEARSYQAEGVLSVEMEAAALFAIASYRKVELASAFVITDHLLAEDRWSHAFGSEAVEQASIALLDASIQALSVRSSPN